MQESPQSSGCDGRGVAYSHAYRSKRRQACLGTKS
jgi:hypothetical protein